MCYNCGCGMPNNDMGKAENITEKTIAGAAKAMDTTPEEARKNAHELLDKVMNAPEIKTDRTWRP